MNENVFSMDLSQSAKAGKAISSPGRFSWEFVYHPKPGKSALGTRLPEKQPIRNRRRNFSHIVVGSLPGNDFFMGKDKGEKNPWVRLKKKKKSVAVKKMKRRNNNNIFVVRPKGLLQGISCVSIGCCYLRFCVLACDGSKGVKSF